MLRNMLDTNLCMRLLRDRPQGLRPRFNAEAETLASRPLP
jgi:tRNA(fMet)-specific endonuclease VapC